LLIQISIFFLRQLNQFAHDRELNEQLKKIDEKIEGLKKIVEKSQMELLSAIEGTKNESNGFKVDGEKLSHFFSSPTSKSPASDFELEDNSSPKESPSWPHDNSTSMDSIFLKPLQTAQSSTPVMKPLSQTAQHSPSSSEVWPPPTSLAATDVPKFIEAFRSAAVPNFDVVADADQVTAVVGAGPTFGAGHANGNDTFIVDAAGAAHAGAAHAHADIFIEDAATTSHAGDASDAATNNEASNASTFDNNASFVEPLPLPTSLHMPSHQQLSPMVETFSHSLDSSGSDPQSESDTSHAAPTVLVVTTVPASPPTTQTSSSVCPQEPEDEPGWTRVRSRGKARASRRIVMTHAVSSTKFVDAHIMFKASQSAPPSVQPASPSSPADAATLGAALSTTQAVDAGSSTQALLNPSPIPSQQPPPPIAESLSPSLGSNGSGPHSEVDASHAAPSASSTALASSPATSQSPTGQPGWTLVRPKRKKIRISARRCNQCIFAQ
jgi:hypothetical protein